MRIAMLGDSAHAAMRMAHETSSRSAEVQLVRDAENESPELSPVLSSARQTVRPGPVPQAGNDRQYLSKRELVRQTGLSAATIQRYKDQRRIPFFQPGGKGGRVLFPPDAIEAATQMAAMEPRSTEPQQAGTQAVSVQPRRLPGPRPRWRTSTPINERR